MTDDQYNKFCDDFCISHGMRIGYRETIKKTFSYQAYELQLANKELKNSLIDVLPKWIKRFLK